MNDYISVIGAINDADFGCLEKISHMHGLTVQHLRQFPETGIFSESNLPLAFICCIPPDLYSITELFKVLPIGTGERIPLFQSVTGTIDPRFTTLPIQGFFETPATEAVLRTIVQTALRNKSLLSKNQALSGEIVRCRDQKRQLIKIGMSLTKERDLENLLKTILSVAREIAGADAGSIYIRERTTPGGVYSSYLTFKITQNDSVDVGSFNEFHLPIDENSIAGYVAKTTRTLNISDVDHLDCTIPCHFDRGWEQKIGYHTFSMLTLPLKNSEGEVVGVLQLINKKPDVFNVSGDDVHKNGSGGFTFSDEEYVQSIASQAAVSIERAHYHECIKALFDGFLSSSIAAIDERDKVTSGHSKRVMGYATAFVEAVRNDSQGRFSQLVSSSERIRQFQYAALLHDIGKIGVPESLLTKETRLDRGEWSTVCMRFKCIELQLQIDPEHIDWKSAEQLNHDLDFLYTVNKSGYCDDTMYERLLELKKKTWTFAGSEPIDLFTKTEWDKLSIRKGNLTEEERMSMNSHTVSTHRILSKIPWTKNLEQIPTIAAQHHEKCDGSGYPGGLTRDEILLESKILAVIDIYEALVSQDRPYKPKIPVDKALAILRSDADHDLLDKDVVEFFIEKKVYETYMMNGER